MQPVGDKIVIQKTEIPEKIGELVLSQGSAVLCTVLAVGKGMPYGRGEFYEPTLQKGQLVLVAQKTWDAAETLRLRLVPEQRPVGIKVIHEREVLVAVEESEL